MRVLAITNMYPTPDKPAFATFVKNQVESVRGEGVEVDVLFANGRKNALNYLWAFPRLWARLLTRRYDLIQAHYVFSGIIARAQFLYPVVLMHHGPEVFRSWESIPSRIITPLMDRVIVRTQEMKDRMGCERAEIISAGINLDLFKPLPKDECRELLGLPRDKKLILWAGEYFRPEKRYDIVQAAVAILQKRVPDAELVLVTGQPHDVIPKYMNACDALLLVSSAEGSPNVIKEAMACNLPVVSTAVGDVPQIIEGTEGCYLCSQDPQDAADKLEQALKFGKRTNGREKVGHLEISLVSRRIISIYEDLLREKSRRGLNRLRFWKRNSQEKPRKKRVAIVKLSYYPQHNHIRRDAETLVNHGYEVDVISFRRKGQKKHELLNGVNVYRVPGEQHRQGVLRYLFEYGSFFILSSLKLAQLSIKKRYDVVEVCTMPDFLVFNTIIPRLMGSKVILYMFENMAQLYMGSFKKGPNHIGTRIIRFFEKASAHYAHRVISADGLPLKQVLESHGIRGDKIAVVQNVPNTDVFKITTPPSEEDGHFRVVTHGSILKRYGIQTLAKAAPLLVKEIPEIKVDIVGDGEYRPEVEKLVNELGMQEYVHFTGSVPHEEVPSYLTRAQIGVAPMINDVGLPNKLFEYLALGIPAVVSAHPTLKATFGDDCVLYFRPGDEEDLAKRILELYHSPEKRAELVSHATEFYRTCEWSSMKYEYLKVYEDVLKKA